MDFQAWPKTPRLFRDIVVTEKIDGTNAAINIQEYTMDSEEDCKSFAHAYGDDGKVYCVGAQSRNRLIYPTGWRGDSNADNSGFAHWVDINAQRLFDLLGPGRHYGEWWGRKIARNYGVDYRQFSLFNTDKWGEMLVGQEVQPDGAYAPLKDGRLGGVPVLYRGKFDQFLIEKTLIELKSGGSVAAPGFMNPEGICVYHTQSKQVYKVTLDNNDKGKWESV